MTAPFTPVGDPDAMRDLARALMGRADLIADAGIAPSSSLAGATFEGPAAVRLRGALDEARAEALEAASRLRDVATTLVTDAGEVERRNNELELEAERAADRVNAGATPPVGGAVAGNEAPASAAAAAPLAESPGAPPASTPADPPAGADA
jgi:hypothetical protein